MVDTTVPVITLVGADPQVIEVGSPYVELGATASDNYDGDITGSIVIDATAVDTAVVGSYPVTYDVTYRYANGIELTVKNGPGSGWHPNSCSIRFEGDRGWIRRKTWSAGLEASDPAILQTRYRPETTKHWPLPPA